MMNREPLLPKPHNRFVTHRMLFVKDKPMFEHMVSFRNRMIFHPKNHNVTIPCFAGMSPVCISGLVFPVRTQPAITTQHMFCPTDAHHSHFPANRTFNRNLFVTFCFGARRTQVVGCYNFSSAPVFVRSKQSLLSALLAFNRPYSVAVILFGARRDAQQIWLKLYRWFERTLFRHNESHSFCSAAPGWLMTNRMPRSSQIAL